MPISQLLLYLAAEMGVWGWPSQRLVLMDAFWEKFSATVKRADFTLSVVVLSVVAVVTGPFGTYIEVPLGVRAIYIPILVILGAFTMAAVEALVHVVAKERHLLIRSAAVSLIMAAIYTPVTLFISNTATQGLREPRETLHVILIVIGLTSFFYFIRHISVAEPEEVTPVEQTRLREVLGLTPSMTLYALSADDHYVRVLTDQGEHRVLLRFSDALREIEEVEGLHLHRSHWVAKLAAARVERAGQSYRMILTDGREIPVSRGKIDQAEALVADQKAIA